MSVAKWFRRQPAQRSAGCEQAMALADAALADLDAKARQQGINRPTFIVMVGVPDGQSHDAYAVRYTGACLSAIGLVEQGYESLRKSIRHSWT